MTDAQSPDGGYHDVPEGWVREELTAGMETVTAINADQFVGMGGGFKCETCDHFVPIEAIDNDTCPMCGTSGMIGTVIQGVQEVVSLHPEGWFDDE